MALAVAGAGELHRRPCLRRRQARRCGCRQGAAIDPARVTSSWVGSVDHGLVADLGDQIAGGDDDAAGIRYRLHAPVAFDQCSKAPTLSLALSSFSLVTQQWPSPLLHRAPGRLAAKRRSSGSCRLLRCRARQVDGGVALGLGADLHAEHGVWKVEGPVPGQGREPRPSRGDRPPRRPRAIPTRRKACPTAELKLYRPGELAPCGWWSTRRGHGGGAGRPASSMDYQLFDPREGQGPGPGDPQSPTKDEVGNISQTIDAGAAYDMHGYQFRPRGRQAADRRSSSPTSALRQSRVCGPVVDVAEQVKRYNPGKRVFIHMEIYNQTHPQQSASAAQAHAYHLESAVDRDQELYTIELIEGGALESTSSQAGLQGRQPELTRPARTYWRDADAYDVIVWSWIRRSCWRTAASTAASCWFSLLKAGGRMVTRNIKIPAASNQFSIPLDRTRPSRSPPSTGVRCSRPVVERRPAELDGSRAPMRGPAARLRPRESRPAGDWMTSCRTSSAPGRPCGASKFTASVAEREGFHRSAHHGRSTVASSRRARRPYSAIDDDNGPEQDVFSMFQATQRRE